MPNYMTELSPDNNNHVYQIKDKEAAPIDLLKDTVGWTGKNLLPYPYGITSYSANGVTFTVNDDGSVTVNGTATADTPLRLFTGALQNGNYIISRGFTNVLAGIRVEGWSGSTWVKTIVGASSFSSDEPTFTIDNDGYNTVRIDILIKSGAVLNNQKFYPMLRDASIIDSTYEPYHKSVEAEIEQVYADNGVLGAKNLLSKGWVTQTINDITFTANSDGSVTVNGTASGLAIMAKEYTFKAGDKFILSGCPEGGSDSTYRLDVNKENFGANDYGNGVLVNIPSDGSYNVRIRVPSGATVNNLTFYPMLRLATDPDSTYQPYAMTNRELTEMMTVQESAVTNIVEGASVLDNTNYLIKMGKIVTLDLALGSVTATAHNDAIFRVPEGFRPKYLTEVDSPATNQYGYLPTNGGYKARANISNGSLRIHTTWITS